MKHFTKEQQDLEDKRESLLTMIVKLKQINRHKLLEWKKQKNYLDKIANELLIADKERFELQKQGDHLNRTANELLVADKERLKLFAFELNKMWKEE